MPKLEDVVRISYRGRSPVPDPKNELEHSAYCLYEAVKGELVKSGCQSVTRGDITGLEGAVSVPNLFGSLWPSLARNRGGEESEDAKKIRVSLYDYLRDSVNMVCIRPGNRTRMSVWWVRNEWHAVTITEDDQHKQPEAGSRNDPGEIIITTTAAAKPAESAIASGDRARSAIINPDGTLSCRICGEPFSRENSLTRHFFTRHTDLNELIINVLEQYGGGGSAMDIKELLYTEYGYDGGGEVIRRRLIDLAQKEGSSVVRHDSLYYFSPASGNDITVRKSIESISSQNGQVMYICREPFCTASFGQTGTRMNHEYSQHPDSPWRTWICPLCETETYNRRAWATHVTVTHKMSSFSQEYKDMLASADRDASELTKIAEHANTEHPVSPSPPVQVASPSESQQPSSLLEQVTGLIDERNRFRSEIDALRIRVAELEAGSAGAANDVLAEENSRLKYELAQLTQLFKQIG